MEVTRENYGGEKGKTGSLAQNITVAKLEKKTNGGILDMSGRRKLPLTNA